jgi:hypothetical protein
VRPIPAPKGSFPALRAASSDCRQPTPAKCAVDGCRKWCRTPRARRKGSRIETSASVHRLRVQTLYAAATPHAGSGTPNVSGVAFASARLRRVPKRGVRGCPAPVRAKPARVSLWPRAAQPPSGGFATLAGRL